MGWVSTAARKSLLRSRISDYELKLTKLSEEMQKLTSYASATSDGIVTYDEMGELPADYYDTAMAYNEYAFANASAAAQQKTSQYMATNQINDPNIHNTCYNSYLESELKAIAQMNKQRLQYEEEKLASEQESIQTLLRAAQSEYDSIKDSIDNSIQRDTIKLA